MNTESPLSSVPTRLLSFSLLALTLASSACIAPTGSTGDPEPVTASDERTDTSDDAGSPSSPTTSELPDPTQPPGPGGVAQGHPTLRPDGKR